MLESTAPARARGKYCEFPAGFKDPNNACNVLWLGVTR